MRDVILQNKTDDIIQTIAWNRATLTGNRQNPSLTGNSTCNLKRITVRLKLSERINTPWQVPPCLLFHWICIQPKRETGRKHFGFLLMKWLTNSVFLNKLKSIFFIGGKKPRNNFSSQEYTWYFQPRAVWTESRKGFRWSVNCPK